MRLCCAKDSASAAQPCQRGPGAASTASTPGALVFVARRRRSAERGEASTAPRRLQLGGPLDSRGISGSCLGLVHGARTGPKRFRGVRGRRRGRCVPFAILSRVSAATSVRGDDDAVSARRELSDAGAWRLAADGHARACASMSIAISYFVEARAVQSYHLLLRAAHASKTLSCSRHESTNRHRTPWPSATSTSTALAALH
jgi:hypothetical protein